MTILALLAAAILLVVADRHFGLSYLLVGCAIVLAVVALGLSAGLSLDDMEPFMGILVSLVFTPIVVRLYFVREVRRHANGEAATPDGDRNSGVVLEYAGPAASLLKTFTFFFVQGTLVILLIHGTYGVAGLTPAHVAGIPAAAAWQATAIAERYTESGVWHIVWGAVGLFVAGPLLLAATVAVRFWAM